ncbi:MAG: hypothetical protein HY901_18600 [Deltaproteobacteria bacterium]|nr:hypothetical protein [Deltaproteobacteria bacterium]
MHRSLSLVAAGVLRAVPARARAAGGATDITLLAWSSTGELALIEERRHGPEGGGAHSYRVVGPGVEQIHYEVSRNFTPGDPSREQKISEKECVKNLRALKKVLKSHKFTGVTLHREACEGMRGEAVTIGEKEAAAADGAELEPLGDALVRRDWRLRLDGRALAIEGPKGSKELRLPRPIRPEQAHVLLSPQRRLLLILVSSQDGDQSIAAGFASKSGEIADFQ